MPLHTIDELMGRPSPMRKTLPAFELGDEVTLVVPDTEPTLTLGGLAHLISEFPEFGEPGQIVFFESDRLMLGNGAAMVAYQTLRFEDAA